MVKVEIVDEKDESNSVYASSSSSHTGSTDSLDSTISEPEAETFFDRVAALVDIIPPTTRYSITSRASKTASAIKRAGKFTGNLVWIVTTSALLVGLPLALSLEDEAKIVQQEKEMLAQQQGAQQVRCPGHSTPIGCTLTLLDISCRCWADIPPCRVKISNKRASSRPVSDPRHPSSFRLDFGLAFAGYLSCVHGAGAVGCSSVLIIGPLLYLMFA